MAFSDTYYYCTLYLQHNEVAAVQPPPVVQYSQSHSANNGAEHYSHVDSPIRQPDSHGSEHSQPAIDPQYNTHYSSHPDTRYPPHPDYRFPARTDRPYIPVQPERYPIPPVLRPSTPIHQPEDHVHTSGPGVSL